MRFADAVRVPRRTPAPSRPAVPFLDLTRQYDELRDDLLADLAEVVDSTAFVGGPAVERFEHRFASFCGRQACVGVASGLDALRLALIGAGTGPGDEVVVPANTFIATFEAVSQSGARPVAVDVTELDYNLDVAACETAIGSRTRAVVPVHLYGQLADMRPLLALAERSGVAIVEDAAQAPGSERDGIQAGAHGLAAAFSFYPGKNLGAFGDAGGLVTDDEGLASLARALREHGQRRKYVHELQGYTARLDSIQAAVLLRKLPLLRRWNDERRAVARLYCEGLDGVGDIRLPPVAPGSNPVWHLFVVRTGGPEALGSFLAERGIATGRHYPEPVHLSRAYATLGYRRGSFPVTEALAGELLSLPIFPGMSEGETTLVIEAVREFFHG